jgi:hypothetical protein
MTLGGEKSKTNKYDKEKKLVGENRKSIVASPVKAENEIFPINIGIGSYGKGRTRLLKYGS